MGSLGIPDVIAAEPSGLGTIFFNCQEHQNFWSRCFWSISVLPYFLVQYPLEQIPSAEIKSLAEFVWHLCYNPKLISHLYMKWFTSYHDACGSYEQILCPCEDILWSVLRHIWHIKFQTLDSGNEAIHTHANEISAWVQSWYYWWKKIKK